jgi:hypothetical protein
LLWCGERHDNSGQSKLGWPSSDRDRRSYQLGGRIVVMRSLVAFQGSFAR